MPERRPKQKRSERLKQMGSKQLEQIGFMHLEQTGLWQTKLKQQRGLQERVGQ